MSDSDSSTEESVPTSSSLPDKMPFYPWYFTDRYDVPLFEDEDPEGDIEDFPDPVYVTFDVTCPVCGWKFNDSAFANQDATNKEIEEENISIPSSVHGLQSPCCTNSVFDFVVSKRE